MKKRWMHLLLPVAALVLELLPYGAVCNFANPEGLPWRKTYSYFDLLPFGYANFSPLLTALLTCVIVVLLLIAVFVGARRLMTAVRTLSAIAAGLSLCPLLLGVDYYSMVGMLISLALLAETVWLSVAIKREKE